MLIPDFKGVWSALETVMEARPDILNHNLESIARLSAELGVTSDASDFEVGDTTDDLPD